MTPDNISTINITNQLSDVNLRATALDLAIRWHDSSRVKLGDLSAVFDTAQQIERHLTRESTKSRIESFETTEEKHWENLTTTLIDHQSGGADWDQKFYEACLTVDDIMSSDEEVFEEALLKAFYIKEGIPEERYYNFVNFLDNLYGNFSHALKSIFNRLNVSGRSGYPKVSFAFTDSSEAVDDSTTSLDDIAQHVFDRNWDGMPDATALRDTYEKLLMGDTQRNVPDAVLSAFVECAGIAEDERGVFFAKIGRRKYEFVQNVLDKMSRDSSPTRGKVAKLIEDFLNDEECLWPEPNLLRKKYNDLWGKALTTDIEKKISALKMSMGLEGRELQSFTDIMSTSSDAYKTRVVQKINRHLSIGIVGQFIQDVLDGNTPDLPGTTRDCKGVLMDALVAIKPNLLGITENDYITTAITVLKLPSLNPRVIWEDTFSAFTEHQKSTFFKNLRNLILGYDPDKPASDQDTEKKTGPLLIGDHVTDKSDWPQ